jgi:pantetheine-phosphate adenylyltransferase
LQDRIAVYPGSFDPLTNGHLDIIRRGVEVFDRLVVGIAENSRKSSLFTVEERLDLIREVLVDQPRVEVEAFEGLTVEYAVKRGAIAILRGLRAVADFEYELQMANMNRKLSPVTETLFMMTSEKYFFISSQNVKEVAQLGGDISQLVPPQVAARLAAKYGLTPRA